MKIDQAKRKRSLKQVEDIINDARNILVIHYSCESFYERPDGSSPKITSIAVRKLSDGQTHSFSIHKEAELMGVSLKKIENEYTKLEKSMLARFYKFIKDNKDKTFLHWNMRDENFGFAALELRFKILKGTPVVIDDDKKRDLARILIDIYGVGYIGHPRLKNLVEKNKITEKNFLDGQAEADAFNNKNYIALHQSTLRKVDIFANIIQRIHENTLKTNTTTWELQGGKILAVFKFLHSNVYIGGAIALATIIGVLITIIKFFC